MSREVILEKVRAALGPRRSDGRRLESPQRHLVPRGEGGQPDEQFIARLEEHGVTVKRAGSAAEVPAAVVSVLDALRLPLSVRLGADARLAAMRWDGLLCRSGRADAADETGLSHAEAGIAETGTLVLVSGAGNPTSLAFLPETHIVALAVRDVVGCTEEAFDMVRARHGRGSWPRALNLITGASRTGDIGGRIVFGAHGPRRLAVVLYGDGSEK